MVNEVIEEVVTFENGGLNTSVDAMVEVIRSYVLCLLSYVLCLVPYQLLLPYVMLDHVI